ncbi:hypothetical protein [Candidatus Rickettsia colombianensi]|uniref:hypothetical protein n=1 Tax=Candidatus Rickettsia colombianensi TaxID=1090944 RepID=UPI000EF1EA50|nr:hypothetical protein [Candidatus Rickettsia colombianensi]
MDDFDVIPAKAGIQKITLNWYKNYTLIDKINLKKQVFYRFYWIPAFAGMTSKSSSKTKIIKKD